MLGSDRSRADDPLERERGRPTCARCRRPTQGCYCAHLEPIETRTRLVILQHPRERTVAIGTAHMASLCLTNSELHVGVDWTRSTALDRALSDPARPPILLYPGRGAIDIAREPPRGPVTLVVVDGTWAQTRKVVRMNPSLAALPRYSFVPEAPSEYRIRKEPDAASVATIEALVHALTALERGESGESGEDRFARLLAPFRAMIDFQLECERRARGLPSRHAKRKARVRRMRVPRVIGDRFEDVVCVAAEANAWPYAVRAADPACEDELVHWAAHRPSTGETLSFVVAPRRAIAPGTVPHTGLGEAVLRGGGALSDLHARWRAFLRDTDVACSWGGYEPGLFERAGGQLPERRLDLRHIARDVATGPVGTLAAFAEHAVATREDQPSPMPVEVPGRAGRKLRAIAEILHAMKRGTCFRGGAAAPQKSEA